VLVPEKERSYNIEPEMEELQRVFQLVGAKGELVRVQKLDRRVREGTDGKDVEEEGKAEEDAEGGNASDPHSVLQVSSM
jgi:hypothetical protein